MKKPLLAALATVLAWQVNAQSYTPITLSGFNADVIANGSGSATASTSNGVDNSDFAFVAQNFVNPSGQSPAAGTALPNNGTISSAITTTNGLTFQLASYTGNNSRRIASGASGTVTLSTPISANDLYILLTPVAYSGTCTATITVNFTDGTNQVFSGISLNNWYNSSGAAYSGTSRVNRTTNVIDVQTGGPKMFQQKLTLSVANTTKLIQSILVNHTSAVSTNNVLNVMAVTAASTFATDAGIIAVSAPNSGCTLSSTETITATVKNHGTTALSNIPVSYKINTNNPVNEVIPGPIAAGATLNYSFNTKANLSTAGTYSLEVRTSFTGDLAPTNDVITRSVVLSATPNVPTVTTGSTSFCSGSNVTLTAASTTTGATYQWYLNGTAINGATSASYTANTAGSYTATAIVGGSCASPASAATTLTVKTTPAAPSLSASGSYTICTGDSVTLTASSATPGVTYNWFKNGNLIAGVTTAIYKAKTSGTYTVTATANGCGSPVSIARTVTVNSIPFTPTVTQSGSVLTSSASTGNQWYKNNAIIPGATAKNYTVTSSGTYKAVVTINNCSSLPSNSVNMTIAGLGEDMAGLDVKVYPNPSNGLYNIELPQGKVHELTVTDLTGKVISNQKVNSKTIELDLQKSAKGIYILKLQSEGKTAIRKLVVE